MSNCSTHAHGARTVGQRTDIKHDHAPEEEVMLKEAPQQLMCCSHRPACRQVSSVEAAKKSGRCLVF
jgi:hypothetical protein